MNHSALECEHSDGKRRSSEITPQETDSVQHHRARAANLCLQKRLRRELTSHVLVLKNEGTEGVSVGSCSGQVLGCSRQAGCMPVAPKREAELGYCSSGPPSLCSTAQTSL